MPATKKSAPHHIEPAVSATNNAHGGALKNAAGVVRGEISSSHASKIVEAEISILLRGLLHELRNPLSSILTAASLVQDTARDSSEVSEETSMLLGVIKKESLRLNHILTEFSNYIKLPAPQPHVFDLVAMMRSLIAELQREHILHHGITIEDGLPATSSVFADPTQIHVALHHLLSNAAEAMPENGTLRLLLREGEDRVILCLGDSGAGFTPEIQERAFQPFFSTKQSSVGLGLSAARAILEVATGRIWIENAGDNSKQDVASPPGGKNLVCLELPLAPSEVSIKG
jgi:signal transduction histidine kinase